MENGACVNDKLNYLPQRIIFDTRMHENIVVHIGRINGCIKIYVVQLADMNMTMFSLIIWLVKIILIVAGR